MDKPLTIDDLHNQLAAREAEMQCVKEELTREVAERKRTEHTLRESEERFRLLVEQTHDVVYAVAPDGILTYVSPYFSHYGYAPEELISTNFIEDGRLCHDLSYTLVDRVVRRYAADVPSGAQGAASSAG